MVNTIREEYYGWLLDKVMDDRHLARRSYCKLLSYLFDTEFVWLKSMPMDENRAIDGLDLRRTFASDCGYIYSDVIDSMGHSPCSMLEMMIAVAVRCEVHIMQDEEFGNRTGQWFWTMIVNLGLDSQTDEHFDECAADAIIAIFTNRQYERNGEGGGLFVIHNSRYDMRTTEIWYQLNYYLSEMEGIRR